MYIYVGMLYRYVCVYMSKRIYVHVCTYSMFLLEDAIVTCLCGTFAVWID